MQRLLALFLFLFLLVPDPVLAESPARNDGATDPASRAARSSLFAGFNAGIGGSGTTNEYRGMSSDGTFLPLIGYEGEHLYLRGVSGGLHLLRNDWFEFNVQLSYLPQHFYAGNSDSWAMRRLDDRYSSMLAGLNARLLSPYGILTVTGSMDVLGYSNGVILDGNYSYPLQFGRLNVIPTVGVQWTDANYNDYYYGIDYGESRKSGLSEYEPSSSVAPYGQLTARFGFTENWSAFASFRALFLDKEVTNSPMVEKSEKYTLGLGLMYGF